MTTKSKTVKHKITKHKEVKHKETPTEETPKKHKSKFSKFLEKHYSKLDTVFGIFIGAIIILGLWMTTELSPTGIVLQLKSFTVPLIKFFIFVYCVKQAHVFVKPPYRTTPFRPANMWQFLSGNLISLAWIGGGLIFTLGTEAIVKLLDLWG